MQNGLNPTRGEGDDDDGDNGKRARQTQLKRDHESEELEKESKKKKKEKKDKPKSQQSAQAPFLDEGEESVGGVDELGAGMEQMSLSGIAQPRRLGNPGPAGDTPMQQYMLDGTQRCQQRENQMPPSKHNSEAVRDSTMTLGVRLTSVYPQDNHLLLANRNGREVRQL